MMNIREYVSWHKLLQRNEVVPSSATRDQHMSRRPGIRQRMI